MKGTLIVAAAALDAVVGDPPKLPHPVDGVAWLARLLAARLPRTRLGGAALLVTVTGTTAAAAWLAGGLGGPPAEALLVGTALAGRSLRDHVLAVWRPLAAGDLPAARLAVSRIVGRDTAGLDAAGIARAALESAAESTNDGYVAPLFWAAVGGAPAAWAYKAVNTLDSLYGYRDEPHRAFGWASARADDLANWLPARCAAALIALACGRPGDAWRAVRDGAARHPSPNAGYPEAALAGGTGIRLGGRTTYRGVSEDRPVLAPWGRSPGPADVRSGLARCLLAAALAAAVAAAVARR